MLAINIFFVFNLVQNLFRTDDFTAVFCVIADNLIVSSHTGLKSVL